MERQINVGKYTHEAGGDNMNNGQCNQRGRRGFTLVELLVVMAIITILASISIPVVVNYIRQGQSTRALADINGIETALTEVLADAGRSKLEQLFDSNGVAAYLNSRNLSYPPVDHASFQAATNLYTRALTAILRSGRNVLGAQDAEIGAYANVLQADVVRKLGTSYIDIGFDPWGNLYNIYPGPWTGRRGNNRLPIPFRIFYKSESEQRMPGANSLQQDELNAMFEDIDNNESFEAGFPAPSNEIAFIWSNGQNLLSSQALYSALPYPALPIGQRAQDPTRYDPAQPDACCGGDDINNWDNANSWTRFY